MRVRADRDFRTYVGGVLLRASAGSEFGGAAARAMLDTRCPVTRLDEEPKSPEAEPEALVADEPVEEPEPETDPVGEKSDGVPDGNVGEILDWVDDDPDRARRALDAERAREHPRSTLIKQLTAI